MIALGCALVLVALMGWAALVLIPQASPNPLVEATLNWRLVQGAIALGALGVALIVWGVWRNQRR